MTPPRRRNQPNDRTQRTAARLLAIAPLITQLVEHHRDELAALGFPGSGGGERVRGGKAPLTPTERDAVKIFELTSQREDLRDAITDLEQRSHTLVRMVHHQLGIPMPSADGVALCCDKQRGLEGSIEWGDPLCREIPSTRQGLCSRCYQRERVWRKEHGLKFRGEDAA